MKNEYRITKKLINSWAREYHLHGAYNILLFILWCIVGVIGTVGVISSIALKVDWLVVYFYSLMIIVALFKLFISRFIVWARRYKLYAATYGVDEWIRTTELLENEIVLTDHTSVTRLKYSTIQKIQEKDNVIMIFMNHNMALRLYKDAFVEGSWQECKSLLQEKMQEVHDWYAPFLSLNLCNGVLTPMQNDGQDMLEIHWQDGMWIDVGYIEKENTYYITTVADDAPESWNHPLSEIAVNNKSDLLKTLQDEILRCRKT